MPPRDESTQSLPQPRSEVIDAIRWWELRRIPYNLALIAMAAFVVVRSWPHFRPAFVPGSLPPVAGLGAIWNLFYCAAYLIEFSVHGAGLGGEWRRRRWILWVAGTLLALFLELYWILDEIYPSVV